jgi:hypothetical protein
VFFVAASNLRGGGLALAAAVLLPRQPSPDPLFSPSMIRKSNENCQFGDNAIGLQIAQSRGLGQATKWYRGVSLFDTKEMDKRQMWT